MRRRLNEREKRKREHSKNMRHKKEEKEKKNMQCMNMLCAKEIASWAETQSKLTALTSYNQSHNPRMHETLF